MSVGTRPGYRADVDKILASSDAIDDSEEARAAGTQWSASDASNASFATSDGGGYDNIAYAVDLVGSTLARG